MKKTILGFALLAVFSAGVARADEAKELFEKKCAVCHGKDGKATPMGQKMGAKDFTGLADPKGDLAPVVAAIASGKPPKMQAFKGKLTDAQIEDIAKYIRAGMK